MTKKARALEHKIAWNTAIAEGRLVKTDRGFCAFLTVADAEACIARNHDAGLSAVIVDPTSAYAEYVTRGVIRNGRVFLPGVR